MDRLGSNAEGFSGGDLMLGGLLGDKSRAAPPPPVSSPKKSKATPHSPKPTAAWPNTSPPTASISQKRPRPWVNRSPSTPAPKNSPAKIRRRPTPCSLAPTAHRSSSHNWREPIGNAKRTSSFEGLPLGFPSRRVGKFSRKRLPCDQPEMRKTISPESFVNSELTKKVAGAHDRFATSTGKSAVRFSSSEEKLASPRGFEPRSPLTWFR